MFDLRADPTDRNAAVDTMRSLLGSLMDASDRGMLEHFEITLGRRSAATIASAMNEAVEWMPAGNVRPFPGRSIEFTKRSTNDAFRGMFSAGVLP